MNGLTVEESRRVMESLVMAILQPAAVKTDTRKGDGR
jgi:hypothetical protein